MDYPEKFFNLIAAKKSWVLGIGLAVLLVVPFPAYFLSAVDASGKSVDLVVEKGHGVKEIAAQLYASGLIKSTNFFVLYSGLSGSAHKLKPGHYVFNQAMSLPKINSALVAGPKEDVVITVIEGETIVEVEDSLVKANVIKKGQLTKRRGKSLEGFFFPDTYRFFPNSSVDDVITRFMKNFYGKALPVLKDAPDAYQALIVASIIEKEVPFSEERPIVAGILYRRLSIGMALQVDVAPETYERPGLPKTPIANPGADAITAAVHPVKSDYLYYLSDPKTRRTIFSKTFDEHVANKFKYLR